MKEFEKKFPKPKDVPGMVTEIPLSWWYAEYNAWRAALECLYEELDYSEGDKRIKDWIDKELEEE